MVFRSVFSFQGSFQLTIQSALLVIITMSGIRLVSRAVSSKVPSAAYGLTVVFGMGTGVSHTRIDTGQN